MKILKFYQPAILFITMLFYSCGSESPVTNNGGGQNNTDTVFSSYVILTPSGGSSDTIYFTDRSLCRGSYSSSQNNTYCLLNDTVSGSSASVTFEGGTTGSPAFTFGFISYNGESLSGSALSGTVSLYESIGGKIKGTHAGTYTGISNTYLVNAVFTVIRTQ